MNLSKVPSKVWTLVAYVAAIWVSLATMAYGVSLRNFGTSERLSSEHIQMASGKVAWVHVKSSGLWPVQFKLDGDDTTYSVPEEMIPGVEALDEIKTRLTTGAEIAIKKYSELVVNIRFNVGTSNERDPMPWNSDFDKFHRHAEHCISEGQKYLLLGLLPLPLLIFMHLMIRRRRRE